MAVPSIVSGERALWPGGGIQLICWVSVPQQCDSMNERSDAEGRADYRGALTSCHGQGVSGPKTTCRAATGAAFPGMGAEGRAGK